MEMDDNTNVQQAFAQPMAPNQMQGMSSSSTMINQQQHQQMSANYGNNNFSMSNILSANALPDIDPHMLLLQASNIQITPIINASIDDLQILNNSGADVGASVDERDDIAVVHETNHMHHNIAISSANNWDLSHTNIFAMNDNFWATTWCVCVSQLKKPRIYLSNLKFKQIFTFYSI